VCRQGGSEATDVPMYRVGDDTRKCTAGQQAGPKSGFARVTVLRPCAKNAITSCICKCVKVYITGRQEPTHGAG
jgi:hypothetical protein